MAGKTGEAALQEKLEQIKLDYFALVEKIKTENVKAASDLEKKLLKDDEEFKARQERERREFEARMEREKEEFKEKQVRERSIADREASERLKQAEDFIDNVRSPVVKEKHKLGQVDIGNELECPVCFQEMKPPVHIWQCAQVTFLHSNSLYVSCNRKQGQRLLKDATLKIRQEVQAAHRCIFDIKLYIAILRNMA